MGKNSAFGGKSEIGTVVISSFIGFALYLLLCAGAAALCSKGGLTAGEGMWSKAALAVAVAVSCLWTRGRIRTQIFLHITLATGLLFAYTAIVSVAASGGEIEILNIIICAFICVVMSFFLSIPKFKNSKLHKRRKHRN